MFADFLLVQAVPRPAMDLPRVGAPNAKAKEGKEVYENKRSGISSPSQLNTLARSTLLSFSSSTRLV
jgi:hypothetical protein